MACDVDARSDLFSLGSVLYELVTGNVAFDGETTSDVIAEILKAEPRPPAEFSPQVPAEVERIISKALRKDRETRYQSAAELLSDLQSLKSEMEFQAKLKETPPGRRPASDRLGSAAGEESTRSRATSRTWIVFLLVVLAVATYFGIKRIYAPPVPKGPRSLAVLPFRNLNGDPKTDFLGFSLADEIITKLDYVNSLTVRPSSSIDKYRDQVIDPKKVAAELKVDTLLTGTFHSEMATI